MSSLQGVMMTTTDKITTLSLGTALGLIALLRNGPHNLREPLLRLLKLYSQPDLELFVRKLAWVAGIAGVVKTNRFLNHLARNNWTFPSDTTWNWPEEVAVVTGGSGGIGGYIVKGLAEKGVKVAIVDIVEPKQFDECKFAMIDAFNIKTLCKSCRQERPFLQMRHHQQGERGRHRRRDHI
jgi:hypothetical protein